MGRFTLLHAQRVAPQFFDKQIPNQNASIDLKPANPNSWKLNPMNCNFVVYAPQAKNGATPIA